ncbi:MAG: Ig-like domain-containing protein, partial [Spirochaetes bacterium]|nr:Ig-like domain-containing protein [Spirochaetota bacterium]
MSPLTFKIFFWVKPILNTYFLGYFIVLLTTVSCQQLAHLQEEVPVTGVSLNKAQVTLAVGGTEQLVATVTPPDATNKKVSWNSSHPTIAPVSSSGLVTGVTEGTATITVTTEDGGFQATCLVTVTSSPPPAGNAVATPSFSINGGTYAESKIVTIQCSTPGATIKFTTDGSDPKTSATAVERSTVFVSMPMTVKAYAYKSGMTDSLTVSLTFEITSGIVFVSSTGNDSNQGTKDHPKKTIQAGIDLADTLFDNGEVRVAGGIYEITQPIYLKGGINLFGSYKADFSERDLVNAPSIIEDKRTSGDCYALTASYISFSSVQLDGFVVKGASATGIESSVCLSIVHCFQYAIVIISNNTFINGSSSYTYGIIVNNSSPLVYNNLFFGGTATQDNNKIYIISDSSPKIYNNTFIAGTGNASRYIISISGSSGCHPTLKNN